MRKKKICSKGSWIGYCLFAYVESQYNRVYRDTGPGGAAGAQGGLATIRPRQATIWPTIRTACAWGMRQRAHGIAKGVPRYKDCIVAWDCSCVAIGASIQCCDTACDTARRARHGLGRDTILYRDWGQKAASLRHGAPTHTCAQRYGRGLLRHNREGAATRSNVPHDTAPVRATTGSDTAGLGTVCA